MLTRAFAGSPRIRRRVGEHIVQFAMGCASDGEGHLYVADGFANSLYKLSLLDDTLLAIARDLDYPHGVAVVENRVYCLDWGHHRVVVFDLQLNALFSIGGQGAGLGEFLYPRGTYTQACPASL